MSIIFSQILLCIFLAFSSSANANTGTNTDVNTAEIEILISFEGKEAVAVLANNPTSQSLLKQLPVTVNFSDYAGAEKVAYLNEKLVNNPNISGYDPEFGDIACYLPWGNFIIFYREQPYANGLMPMGKLKSGAEEFTKMNKDFQAKIERIK